MTLKTDVYTRITNRIVADLEPGPRPWLRPWNGEHAAGRITRPLRHNGIPYRGINVVTLWMTATARGYACPIWLTYNQARELGAQVGGPVAAEPKVRLSRNLGCVALPV